jgi:autotransporter-associated beta strand protein
MQTTGIGKLLVGLSVLALCARVHAAAYNWNSTSGGNWSLTTGSGWNTGGGVDYPKAVGDSAVFQQDFANNTTISIDVPDATVGSLGLKLTTMQRTFNLSGTLPLTFDATGTGPATLSVLSDTYQCCYKINVPVSLNDDLVVTNDTRDAVWFMNNITGAGKKIICGLGRTYPVCLNFEGNNTNLTGGLVLDASSYVTFSSQNAMGGGGNGNIYVPVNATAVLLWNPADDTDMSKAVAKINPTSRGMFGWGGRYVGGGTAGSFTVIRNIDLSGVPNLRLGANFAAVGVTGGSLLFDFAHNGNKYAIGNNGAIMLSSSRLDINQVNYFTGSHDLDTAQASMAVWKAQDYSGKTVIYGGSGAGLTLAGNGTILNSPLFIINNLYGLVLDNNSSGPAQAGSPAAANLSDRIADAASITLNSGLLSLVGSSAGNSSETVGTITLNSRESQIKVDRNGNNATLTGQSLARGDWKGVGTVLGNGTLGTTTFIKFNTAPTLYGGGGAAGTTTMSIIPWLYDSTRTSFVTYDGANGLRPLDTATEYTGTLPDGSVTTQNVLLAAGTTMANDTTINSLVFTNATSATLAFTTNKTLKVSSGGIIVKGAGSMTIGSASSTLDLNGRAGVFLSTLKDAYARFHINAKITNTGGNGVTIGYANLDGISFNNTANDYTGPTTVVAGKLYLTVSEVIPNVSELRVCSGATFYEQYDNRTETVAGLAGAGEVLLPSAAKLVIGPGAGAANGVNLLGGSISPGDDNLPGTLILKQNSTGTSNNLQIASGTINLDIASAASIDAIRVENGSVTITGGTLNLTFLPGFVPDNSGSNTFKIVDVVDDTKTLTGSFPSASISDGGYTYNGRRYAYSTVVSGNDLYLQMNRTVAGTVFSIR